MNKPATRQFQVTIEMQGGDTPGDIADQLERLAARLRDGGVWSYFAQCNPGSGVDATGWVIQGALSNDTFPQRTVGNFIVTPIAK